MSSCSIPGCPGSDQCGVKMFTFPKICHQPATLKKLSTRRQEAWLSALRIKQCIGDPRLYEKWQVCDSHFISGKMASLQDTNNLDWIPTMNLDSQQRDSKHVLRCTVVGCTVSNQGGRCSFFKIPKINDRGLLKDFCEQKISTWLSALRDGPAAQKCVYVCHAHYLIEITSKLRNTANGKTRNTANGKTILLYGISNDSANISKSTDCTTAVGPTGGVKVKRLPLVSPNQPKSTTTSTNSRLFKSGQILRNEHGKFSFGCGYCDAIHDDVRDTLNHINRHFDQGKEEIEESLPSPEFVSCTTADVKLEPEFIETFEELTDEPKLSQESGVGLTTKFVEPDGHSLPNPNIEDLTVFRPCKIRKIDPTPTTDATIKTKCELRPVPPLAAISVTNSNPSSNPHYERIKCSQRQLKPPVGETDPKSHKCQNCDESFPNHIDLRTHHLIRHRLPKTSITKCYQCEMEPSITNESDARRHKCVICQEWFPNHVEFKLHLNDVHVEHQNDTDFTSIANNYQEFTCYICEKTLKQREYLLYHVKGHFEKYLEFQCHLCGLRLRRESDLRLHMKRHENDPTECDVCKRVFANYTRMRMHRLCHTEELKHVCTVCSKRFKLRKYLNRHMAVHNDVKLPCRYCDAKFNFKVVRSAHEKSHHNAM